MDSTMGMDIAFLCILVGIGFAVILKLLIWVLTPKGKRKNDECHG